MKMKVIVIYLGMLAFVLLLFAFNKERGTSEKNATVAAAVSHNIYGKVIKIRSATAPYTSGICAVTYLRCNRDGETDVPEKTPGVDLYYQEALVSGYTPPNRGEVVVIRYLPVQMYSRLSTANEKRPSFPFACPMSAND